MTILDFDITFLFICVVLLITTSVLLPKNKKKTAPKSKPVDNQYLELVKLKSEINALKHENEKLKAEISRINSSIQYICDQCKIFYF